jgi:polyhydroxyalkanoate synthesis regulator phasin
VNPSLFPNSDTDTGAAVRSELAFEKIDKLIDQLAAAGALDEGNKRALDGLIGSWQAQHQEALTAFHLDLAGTREERIQALRQKIELVKQRLTSAQRQLETMNESQPLPDPDDDGPTRLQPRAADEMAAQTTEVAA